jgi:hypothetical protein
MYLQFGVHDSEYTVLLILNIFKSSRAEADPVRINATNSWTS